VELGQVEFFRGLTEEAGMDQETCDALRELIENKNYFGVDELISKRDMPDSLRTVFLKLPELFGTLEQLKQVKYMVNNDRSRKAVERLEKIHAILESYGLAGYVSYDLGMLSKYQYYTGIIFVGYTFGSGEPILKGGRYDRLLSHFGKQAASIGFAVVADQLMAALARQKIAVLLPEEGELIVYAKERFQDAVSMAKKIRKHQETWGKRRVDGSGFLSYQRGL